MSRPNTSFLVTFLLTVVGLLVGAELLLRVPPVSASLPQAYLYYTPGVQGRIDRLSLLTSEGNEPELLFIGNSVAATNIDPEVIELVLGDADTDLKAFTLGLPDLNAEALHAALQQLWLEQTQPDVIVQAVRITDLTDLGSHRSDQAFARGRLETRWTDDSLRSQIEVGLLERSALLRHAGDLWALTTAEPNNGEPAVPATFRVDHNGHQHRVETLEDNLAAYPIEHLLGGIAARDGYQTAIDPAAYTASLETLDATRKLVEASGARYVLLNMPEHPDKYLSAPDGEARYASYLNALRNFATEHGIILIDPTGGDLLTWSDNHIYFDFHHMNETGADQLSEVVATELLDAGVY